MARPSIDKPFTNFTLGLITETTGISGPENSCQDLSNVEIELSGKIRRRLGLTQEKGAGYILDNDIPDLATLDNEAITVHRWDAPANIRELNFVVIQVGYHLYVVNRDDVPMIGGGTGGGTGISQAGGHAGLPAGGNTVLPGGKIDLLDIFGYPFVPLTTAQISPIASPIPVDRAFYRQSKLQSTTGLGRIWFTGSAFEPFYLEYDPSTLKITSKGIGTFDFGSSVSSGYNFYLTTIRDFYYPLARDPNGVSEPVVLTKQRLYRLINAGWPVATIAAYFGTTGVWPAAEKIWYLGKDPAGAWTAGLLNSSKFDVDALQGFLAIDPLRTVHAAGFTPTPTGGIASPIIMDETELATEAFLTCTFFSGRLWVAGDSTAGRPNGVYFSQVLKLPEQAGSFLQADSPTDEHFNQLVATDGGVAFINDADRIIKLVAAGSGVLAFSSNGVWSIRGSLDGFKADNFTIDRISTVGATSAESVVAVEDGVYFWSDIGIYKVTFPSQVAPPIVENITDKKIKKFYDALSTTSKVVARGEFDFIAKRVIWFYPSASLVSITNGTAFQSLRDAALVYDLRLEAFFPQAWNGPAVNNYIVGAVSTKRQTPAQVDQTVYVGSTIVQVGGATVVVHAGTGGYDTFNTMNYVLASLWFNGAGVSWAVTSAKPNDAGFIDFGRMAIPNLPNNPIAAQDYSSFIETSPIFVGDLQRYKEAVYVHSFFDRSESTFEELTVGVFTPTIQGSCFMQAKFDWQTTSTGNKWSLPQQAYRHRKQFTPVDANSIWDTGEGVEYSKLKPRGKGRALALRYYSETLKDFQLLGFSVPVVANEV